MSFKPNGSLNSGKSPETFLKIGFRETSCIRSRACRATAGSQGGYVGLDHSLALDSNSTYCRLQQFT
jgi:hypothetical protein